MSAPPEGLQVASAQAKTSWRLKSDFVLLPLVSLATVLVLLASAEIISRIFWRVQRFNVCTVEDSDGYRYKPNCTTTAKQLETPVITYHYNECAYRSDASCGPKPPGTIRLVVTGSSIAEGYNVVYQDTFPVLAAKELKRITGRDVEVQNMARENQFALGCYRRMNEALALKPDLIVYAFFAKDLDKRVNALQLAHRNDPDAIYPKLPPPPPQRADNIFELALITSRAAKVAQHFWFTNTGIFLQHALRAGDEVDYLRQPLTPAWQARIADFDLILKDMAARCHAAGVPLFLMPVPTRQQAALFTWNEHFLHVDPYAFGRLMQQTALRLHIGYIDAYKAFSAMPDADRDYYPYDLHMNAAGEKVLAGALVRKCLDGSVPAFASAKGQEQAYRN